MTSPAAHALLIQAGLLPHDPPLSSKTGTLPPRSPPAYQDLRVLDNGAGLGQLTHELLSRVPIEKGKLEVVSGDIDESFIEELKRRRLSRSWGSDVQRVDATVRYSRGVVPG